MPQSDLQSVLVDLGLPQQSAARLMEPYACNGEVLTATFVESLFGEDGATAALLVQHGADDVSEGDLVSLASHPGIARASTSELRRDTTCPCCLGGFWHPVKAPCGHPFCLECISSWLFNGGTKSCPMCRASLGAWRPLPANVDKALEEAARVAFASDEDFQQRIESDEAGESASTDVERDRVARQLLLDREQQEQRWQQSSAATAARRAMLEREQQEARERNIALLGMPGAFAIRIGHRQGTCFVEPVNKALPLPSLVREVRWIFHPQNSQVPRAVIKPPVKFQFSRSPGHIRPAFQVHIIFKEEFGRDPLFVRVDSRQTCATEVRVLTLSEFTVSRHGRRTFDEFRKCLEAAAPNSNGASQQRGRANRLSPGDGQRRSSSVSSARSSASVRSSSARGRRR